MPFFETGYRSADAKHQVAPEIAFRQEYGDHAGVLDDDVLGEHVAIAPDAIDDLHQRIQFDPLLGRAHGIDPA